METEKETKLNDLLIHTTATIFLYMAATNLQEAYKNIAHTPEGVKIDAILAQVALLLQDVGFKADKLTYPVLGEEVPVVDEIVGCGTTSSESGGCGGCPSKCH